MASEEYLDLVKAIVIKEKLDFIKEELEAASASTSRVKNDSILIFIRGKLDEFEQELQTLTVLSQIKEVCESKIESLRRELALIASVSEDRIPVDAPVPVELLLSRERPTTARLGRALAAIHARGYVDNVEEEEVIVQRPMIQEPNKVEMQTVDNTVQDKTIQEKTSQVETIQDKTNEEPDAHEHIQQISNIGVEAAQTEMADLPAQNVLTVSQENRVGDVINTLKRRHQQLRSSSKAVPEIERVPRVIVPTVLQARDPTADAHEPTAAQPGTSARTMDSKKIIDEEWGMQGTMLKIFRCVQERVPQITFHTLARRGPVLWRHERAIAARCFASMLELRSQGFINIIKDEEKGTEIKHIELGPRITKFRPPKMERVPRVIVPTVLQARDPTADAHEPTAAQPGTSARTMDSKKIIDEEWGVQGTMLKIFRCVQERVPQITFHTLARRGPVLWRHERAIAARCFASMLELRSQGFINIIKDEEKGTEIKHIELGPRITKFRPPKMG